MNPLASLQKLGMPLRAFAGLGSAIGIKAIAGLVVVKLSALLLGPSIFGQLGQLMTLVAIVGMFAGGGTGNALIQALSSNEKKEVRQRKLGAALTIFVCASAGVSALLVLFCRPLARGLMGDESLFWVILVLAVSHWMVGFSNILQAILGAVNRVRTVAFINGVGTILGVSIFALLIMTHGVKGAALGLVLMPSMLGVVSLWVWSYRLEPEWRAPNWRGLYQDYRELLSYSVVMLFATTALPTAQILVRDLIGDRVGWADVGFWQGTLKISDVYIQFVCMVGMYYALPRFSAQKTIEGLDREYGRVLAMLMPVMLCGFVALYALRDWVVKLLFSRSFEPMRDYFLPYMIGDTFRIVGLLCVYYALSRGARKILIGYELVMAFGLFAAGYLFVGPFGGMAPAYAHIVASVLACLFVAGNCLRFRRAWKRGAVPPSSFAKSQKLMANDPLL
ncbi:MAG: O-antigen translocase [Alphaproteobacteria bacterium]|nr:O-antigen translocase [Alphaproteobacteria bacterium]